MTLRGLCPVQVHWPFLRIVVDRRRAQGGTPQLTATRRPWAPRRPALSRVLTLSRVLICDDRRDVRGVLTDLVRALPGTPAVDMVGDGPAAARAYATAPADLVLIGVRRGTVAGTGALRLLLDRDPTGRTPRTSSRSSQISTRLSADNPAAAGLRAAGWR